MFLTVAHTFLLSLQFGWISYQTFIMIYARNAPMHALLLLVHRAQRKHDQIYIISRFIDTRVGMSKE